jgi:hypothetical protein
MVFRASIGMGGEERCAFEVNLGVLSLNNKSAANWVSRTLLNCLCF